MLRSIPVLIVAIMLAITGAASGIFNQRWKLGTFDSPPHAFLPTSFGDWGSRDESVPEAELRASGATSIDRRWYTNHVTGEVVLATLVYGTAGPVSVHTPDVCFRGSGFEEVKAPTYREIEASRPNRFIVRRFQKQIPTPKAISVHYAWSTGGNWQSPDNPRIAFAGHRSLFKLYAITDTPLDVTLATSEPAVTFLRALLPLLHDSTELPK